MNRGTLITESRCSLNLKTSKRIILLSSLALGISLTTPSIVFAHGGRLDSQGGHNCRVGSCAGTYHCHQALGPACGSSKSSKNKKKY
jgi:hypothetical protein